MQVEHGVDLRRRGVGPGEAEPAEPCFHRAEHEHCLLAQRVGAAFAPAHDALAVATLAGPRLRAAGDHEARRRLRGGHGEREGVERRLGRPADLRTDIGARHRIGLAVEHAPLLQRDDVLPVEFDEAGVGELAGRAQLASAERRQRPAAFANVLLDALEALQQRHRLAELHALDFVSRHRRDSAGILERERQEAVVARREVGGCHGMLSNSAGRAKSLADFEAPRAFLQLSSFTEVRERSAEGRLFVLRLAARVSCAETLALRRSTAAFLVLRDRNFQDRMGGASTSGSAGFRRPSSGPHQPTEGRPS